MSGYALSEGLRRRFARGMLLLCVGIAGALTLAAWLLNDRWELWIDAGLGLAAGGVWLVSRSLPVELLSWLTLGVIYGGAGISMVHHLSDGLWLLTLPFLAHILLRERAAVGANGAGLLVILAALAAHGRVASTEDALFVGNLILAYLAVAIGFLLYHRLLLGYRQQLTKALADKEKQSFSRTLAGNVAHLINNKMAAILMAVPMLKGNKDDARLLRLIRRAAEEASGHANDMLAYAGEKMVFRPVKVPLGLSLRKAISGVQDADVRVDVQGMDAAWRVVGSEEQLSQDVFAHVLANALEANARGIRIRAQLTEIERHDTLSPGRYVRIDIHDDGDGMSDEVAARAFEPFYSTRFLGRGIGLASAQGVVRAHGGQMTLTSRQGHGTCCSIWLPLAPQVQ